MFSYLAKMPSLQSSNLLLLAQINMCGSTTTQLSTSWNDLQLEVQTAFCQLLPPLKEAHFRAIGSVGLLRLSVNPIALELANMLTGVR